jgi:hypothetical protein
VVLHDLEVGALVVIAGAWLASYGFRGRFSGVSTGLRLTAGTVGRFVVGVVFGVIAVHAARRGGGWVALTAVFGLLAAISFSFVAITIYVLVRREKE